MNIIGNIKRNLIKIDRYKLFYIIILLLLSSCHNIRKNPVVTQIQMKYIKSHNECEYVSCSKLDSSRSPNQHIKDTTIINKDLLSDIYFQRSLLEKEDQVFDVNVRLLSILKYKNGNNDTLCLGEFFGTMLNGIQMKDNLMLNYLIKRYSGYYDYFPKEDLIFFNELKDTLHYLEVIRNCNIKYSRKINENDSLIDIVW